MTVRIRSPLRLLWLWSLIGLSAFVGPFLYFFAPALPGHDRQGYLLGRDFVNVWFGAKQVMDGKISHVFKTHDYLADMRTLLGADYPRHNFSYPPHILPLILLFGIAPYFPSLALWSLAGIACFIAALKANRFYKLRWHALLLAALSPAAVFNLMFGQNGAFTAAFFLGGLYLCETSPLTAGVLFGLLTVKPHLGLLIPGVLLLRRNWKCFASASVTGICLAGLSLLLWGVMPWQDYVIDTLPYQQNFLNGPGNIFNPLMPGPWSDAIMMLPGDDWSYVLYAVVAIAALVMTVVAVRKEGLTARSILLIALATFAILPYAFNYDMVAIAGALVVYLGTCMEIGLGGFILLGLLWALPLVLIDIKLLPLPVSSVIIMIALIYLFLDIRRNPEPLKGTA